MSTELKNQIVVNATAAHSSGALTILNEFIKYLSKKLPDDTMYFIFTSVYIDHPKYSNIVFIYQDKQSWFERIYWDFYKLNKLIELNGIQPSLIISLQNTSSRIVNKNIKQLVYYHQSIPLYKYNFNPFKKEEFKLFLYKLFYPYFVKMYNTNSYYVVQLPYLKKMFLKKYSNVSPDRVYVIRPNIPINKPPDIEIKKKTKTFIYPATPLAYKNHKILINAVNHLKKNGCIKDIDFKIIFTNLDKQLIKITKKMKVDKYFSFIGVVSHDDLVKLYCKSIALLFPSKIETVGLPLLEAALCGIKIIASDLFFAKEALEYYKNACFIDPDDINGWANEIYQTITSETNIRPLDIIEENSWAKFDKLIQKLI